MAKMINSNGSTKLGPCPCGTGKTYSDCCGIFISQQKLPATPEELMRSRYTAYTELSLDYIIQTMKAPAADHFDRKEAQEWAKKIRWSGLDVLQTQHDSHTGTVEFCAYYWIGSEKKILHEISEFHCENGRWYYVNGREPPKKVRERVVEKIGRNASCPCGSNKKYKKCCGNTPKAVILSKAKNL